MYLVNERNQVVKLGHELTTPGGEGSIYEIVGDPSIVAKVYHSSADSKKAAKLKHLCLTGNKDLVKIAAWPKSVLFSGNDKRLVKGFIMPRLEGKEIHRLYSPRDRSLEFPFATWEFLTIAARNCSAAFETLHENGVLMADVNEKNLLVTNKGEVRLIDCDSYQIQSGTTNFLCDVGVPLWTPPELQAKVSQSGYTGLERTVNHDRFGMAVLIFELLFMGRHPFAGVPVGPQVIEIHESIQKYLFAFSPHTWQRGVKTPPHTLPLSALPPGLTKLFERAFLPLSERPNARPSGKEWANELDLLRSTQKNCHYDSGHKFWNGLAECPWCQLMGGGAPNFFIAVSINSGTSNSSDEVKVYWGVIQKVYESSLLRKTVDPISLPIMAARPMPIPRPVKPGISMPSRPQAPHALPKPSLLAPEYPPAPAMPQLMPLPYFPHGRSKIEAKFYGALSMVFLVGGATAVWLQSFGSLFASAFGLIVCLYFGNVKSELAEKERRKRLEQTREAKADQIQKARTEHSRLLAEHAAVIKKISEDHERWVAKAETGYLREQALLDAGFKLQLSNYTADLFKYENAIGRYNSEKATWDAECRSRKQFAEQSRREMIDVVDRLRSALSSFKDDIFANRPKLDECYRIIQKTNADELQEIKGLEARKKEALLKHFLDSKLIRHARITGIGRAKTDALIAYGFESAGDIAYSMKVPGIGPALRINLMNWKMKCQAEFQYNPNTPLPAGELQVIKLKYAQIRQKAFIELRAGADTLTRLESEARKLVSRLYAQIPELVQRHAQAIADFEICKCGKR